MSPEFPLGNLIHSLPYLGYCLTTAALSVLRCSSLFYIVEPYRNNLLPKPKYLYFPFAPRYIDAETLKADSSKAK
jgi:hypothetical protein